MIDAKTESLTSPKDATGHPVFQRLGQRPHLSTIYRWMTRGARSLTGRSVRLESMKTPGGRVTSQEAIARFIAALNDLETGTVVATSDSGTARALRELEAEGIATSASAKLSKGEPRLAAASRRRS